MPKKPKPAGEARSDGDLAMEALNEATQAIAGLATVDAVLQIIVDRVRELAGARYAALGIVGEAGAIEQFITGGVSSEERARIGPLPRGRGLLGLIIREGRSFRIPSIARHPDSYGFPKNHPLMTSFLGVPVTVRGQAIGNLYLTDKVGALEFTAHDQRLVELFALHAGIAIENARLHEQLQRLVVVEERDRIGKDLHDGIIQSIYGVTLSLEDVPELLDEDRADAIARIDRAIDRLHLVIRDIRGFIFELRPHILAQGDLQTALAALADDFRLNSMVDLDVALDPAPTRLTPATADQLLHIAHEALSNAARHSGATRARLRLSSEDGQTVLEIVDHGTGFDPRAAPASGHYGIANMRERAVAIRGDLVIESDPGHGTRVVVTISDRPPSP